MGGHICILLWLRWVTWSSANCVCLDWIDYWSFTLDEGLSHYWYPHTTHKFMFNKCHIHLCDCTWWNVFFTCSIFVNSSTKRFLSVLGVFGKYFVWKTWKFQKSSFALFWRLSRGYVKSRASVASSRVIFGDLFASGRSSREGYSEIFAAQLATYSRVDLPVAKNT